MLIPNPSKPPEKEFPPFQVERRTDATFRLFRNALIVLACVVMSGTIGFTYFKG